VSLAEIHYLCSGAFLQEPVSLDCGARMVPLGALGFGIQAQWLAEYTERKGATVDRNAAEELAEQGAQANPVVAIQLSLEEWQGPEQAEITTAREAVRLRQVLAWATGDDVTLFGIVIIGPDDSYFCSIPRHSSRRLRLGFGNTGRDFTRSLNAIERAARCDEHFAFSLGMLHDAQKELNERFKIARLFACLESLAYRLKRGRGARDAVRKLLGLSTGRTGQVSIGGRRFDYDVVLGAGILRDFLFHGVEPDFSRAKPHEEDTFRLLETRPDIYVRDLVGITEVELARWSNGKSGQVEEEQSVESPPRGQSD
jgi:hypothetical protein